MMFDVASSIVPKAAAAAVYAEGASSSSALTAVAAGWPAPADKAVN